MKSTQSVERQHRRNFRIAKVQAYGTAALGLAAGVEIAVGASAATFATTSAVCVALAAGTNRTLRKIDQVQDFVSNLPEVGYDVYYDSFMSEAYKPWNNSMKSLEAAQKELRNSPPIEGEQS